MLSFLKKPRPVRVCYVVEAPDGKTTFHGVYLEDCPHDLNSVAGIEYLETWLRREFGFADGKRGKLGLISFFRLKK